LSWTWQDCGRLDGYPLRNIYSELKELKTACSQGPVHVSSVGTGRSMARIRGPHGERGVEL